MQIEASSTVFSACSLLEEMQIKGPPKAASYGPAAKVAIELILQSANSSFVDIDTEIKNSLLIITRKIAEKFLLDKNLVYLAKKEIDSQSLRCSTSLNQQLSQAGRDIAALLIMNAPALLEMGLSPAQIGNACTKLRFNEISEIFSDPIFIKSGEINQSRVDSILNALDPRSLYSRLKATYQEPALAEMGFAARVVLVRSPILAEERINQAKGQSDLGISSGISAEYTIATAGQKAWFDQNKDLAQFKDCHSALIRLAKQEPEKREQALIEITELISLGANIRDAISLVLKENYYPTTQRAFRLALDYDLTSTSASIFALSETGQKFPTLGISKIKLLKSLPLDWADETIVRVVVGSSFYKKSSEAKQLQEKQEVIDALKANVEAKFKIDRSNSSQYAARRLLSRLNHEEIICFYGVFFNPKTFPDLNEILLHSAEVDKLACKASINGGKASLLQAGIEVGKKSDTKFLNLCDKLSDFLISLNPDVRLEVKNYFYRWLIDHAKKYYKRYIDISPEVVSMIVEATLRNYDPKVLDPSRKDNIDLFKAFAGNIKHFFSYLIKHSLKDSKVATRAYKCFIDLKTSAKAANQSTDNETIWNELLSQRPDLSDGIRIAKSKYEYALKLQANKN